MPIMKRPQLARTLLKEKSSDTSLSNILAAADYLRRLEQIVTKYLPDAFKQHCRISSYDCGKLIILCDSASWSSKFRFHAKHLNTKLRHHHEFSGLIEISALTNLRALSLASTYRRKPSKAKKISVENKSLLLETAKIESDQKLSDALRRLAEHAGPSGGNLDIGRQN